MPGQPRGHRTTSRAQARRDRDAARIPAMEFRPMTDSIDDSAQFAPRTISGTAYSGAMPPNTKLARDNLTPNVVGSTQLASTEGDRAVSSGAGQDNFLVGRHFAGGSAPYHLPENVEVRLGLDVSGDLDWSHLNGNLPDGKIPNIGKTKLPSDTVYTGDGGLVAASILPKLGGMRGKVGRGKLDDHLNGHKLIKDGTLPVSALASRPWSSKTDPAQVRKIVRDMVKTTSLKPKAR